jgi:hypothetical protein
MVQLVPRTNNLKFGSVIPISIEEKFSKFVLPSLTLDMVTLTTLGAEKLNIVALEIEFDSNDTTIEDDDDFKALPALTLQRALLSEIQTEA